MSIRTEALNLLLETEPIIPISRLEVRRARRIVDQRRDGYEQARKSSLSILLATHYRFVIFGSARIDQQDPDFQFVSSLCKELVEAFDIDIVTGGGPGIMTAAHKGSRLAIAEAGSKGVKRRARNHGVGIELPFQEPSNGLAHINSLHPEFSTRLQEFIDKTHASYTAPGGIGTLLELIMILQSRQVGHLEKNYPILAHPHWKPLVETWNDVLYHNRERNNKIPLISASDLDLIKFSDNTAEIVESVGESYKWWKTNIRDKVRFTA